MSIIHGLRRVWLCRRVLLLVLNYPISYIAEASTFQPNKPATHSSRTKATITPKPSLMCASFIAGILSFL